MRAKTNLFSITDGFHNHILYKRRIIRYILQKNIEELSNLLYRVYPFAYELFRRQIVYSTNSPDFQEPIQYKGLRIWNIH